MARDNVGVVRPSRRRVLFETRPRASCMHRASSSGVRVLCRRDHRDTPLVEASRSAPDSPRRSRRHRRDGWRRDVSIYTGTIVEVASPEAIGPAVLKVVKACNAVRERYGFRELTPTTLAHEYALNRCDQREKSSLAVLHLLELPELNEFVPVGYGQSELKHPISFEVDDIYVPASVVHVTYLMAPGSHCEVQCYIESTVLQPPLFEHSACLIARIKLHEDSKPFHSKAGKGGSKPFSITIKEAGKADVVLHATSLTDGIRLLKKKVGITTGATSTRLIHDRLSGKVTSDLVKDGKTCKFAYTKVTLPKKEELEQDMYLVLPFNNEKLLEALREGFGFSGGARAGFMDLKAFRSDPLKYFKDRKGCILSDELKEIVARGFVTKKELKDTLLPYIRGYKTRVNAQFDEFLPSEDFINAHVASTRFDEDAAALLNKVEAEMKWLYDAADAYDDALAAAQAVAAAQRAAAKAAKASPKKSGRKRKATPKKSGRKRKATPKKSGRKRKATVPKKTFVNSDDASDDEVMPVARPLPDNHGPQSFEPFDRVDAFYRPADKWYPATVRSQNDDGTYNVEYDDGYFEDLPVNLLRVKRRKVAAPRLS